MWYVAKTVFPSHKFFCYISTNSFRHTSFSAILVQIFYVVIQIMLLRSLFFILVLYISFGKTQETSVCFYDYSTTYCQTDNSGTLTLCLQLYQLLQENEGSIVCRGNCNGYGWNEINITYSSTSLIFNFIINDKCSSDLACTTSSTNLPAKDVSGISFLLAYTLIAQNNMTYFWTQMEVLCSEPTWWTN